MRVALVSPYDLGAPGGVQSHVAALARELRRLGDEVVVLAPGDGRSSLGPYAGTGPSIEVPFNGAVAPIGLGPRSGARTRRSLVRLAPDVIHVHEPLVPSVGTSAARSRVAPVVATFHAWSDRDRAYRAVRPLARRLVDGLTATLAVSPAAASYHAGALGMSVDRFRIVPNGVEVARFAAPDDADDQVVSRGRDEGPTLLFVGRLDPRKGLTTLIRALVELHRQRPGVRLLVVGEGPERARCERLLPTAMRSAVRFLGRVSHEELVACHRRADLYVSPALGGESFGIVLLEAMAAGTPVVASDLPGYRSVVGPEAGVLVPPGDPAALATAVGALLDDPSRRARMAAAGERTAAAHDWPVVAATIRGVYAEVLRR